MTLLKAMKLDKITSIEFENRKTLAHKTRKELLERRSWERSQARMVSWRPSNGVTNCVVLPRGHKKWEPMINDWIWQHRDPESLCKLALDEWWDESLFGVVSEENNWE